MYPISSSLGTQNLNLGIQRGLDYAQFGLVKSLIFSGADPDWLDKYSLMPSLAKTILP